MSASNESTMSVVRPSQYTCVKCLHYFTSREFVIRHVFSHFSLMLNSPLHICQNCGKIFSNQSKLFGHYFEESKETTFKQTSLIELACASCADTFLSWCSLIKHVFTHISAISSPLHVCTYYSELFEDMTEQYFYKSTSRTSQRRNNYDCNCNSHIYEQRLPTSTHVKKTFKKEQFFWKSVSKELKYTQNNEIILSNEQSPITEKFEKSLKWHSCLERLQIIHASDPSFYVCEKSFTNPEPLKGNPTVNSGEQQFSDAACRKSFIGPGSLEKHKRLNIGKRQFFCELCGKCFTQPSHLKIHKRIHIGERPFSCKVCGKAFTQSGNLKRHQRLHLGEQPVSCEVCGKSFTEPHYLKVHGSIHLQDRLFTCKFCGTRFMHIGHLKRHQQIHVGERPFYCEVCGKSFPHSQSLERHKRLHLR